MKELLNNMEQDNQKKRLIELGAEILADALIELLSFLQISYILFLLMFFREVMSP